jgi:hypothetical protein
MATGNEKIAGIAAAPRVQDGAAAEANREIHTTKDPETQEDAEKEQYEDIASIHRTESQNSHLPLSKARTIAMVVTLTGAAFLNTLSVQASVIILPVIGKDLGIPAPRQQWIVSSYSLAFGCFLVLWGRLADVYGKRCVRASTHLNEY